MELPAERAENHGHRNQWALAIATTGEYAVDAQLAKEVPSLSERKNHVKPSDNWNCTGFMETARDRVLLTLRNLIRSGHF